MNWQLQPQALIKLMLAPSLLHLPCAVHDDFSQLVPAGLNEARIPCLKNRRTLIPTLGFTLVKMSPAVFLELRAIASMPPGRSD